MIRLIRHSLIATALLLVVPMTASAQFELSGSLSAANQNGSDPSVISDPNGVVPTAAWGSIHIVVDPVSNTLDFSMDVDGILQSELRNFGPNATPIHLHLAGGGNAGNFGPISIDLSLGALSTDYTNTATGFTFARSGVSILLADQGGVALGMHPGDGLIVDALQSGDMFVLVHSTKNIFTNAPAGRPVGFPFGEIRGNVNLVPEPSTATLAVLSLGLVGRLRRRR